MENTMSNFFNRTSQVFIKAFSFKVGRLFEGYLLLKSSFNVSIFFEINKTYSIVLQYYTFK